MRSARRGARARVQRSDAGAIRLRESERPGQTITTTPTALRALILSAKAGEFDHFVD
ncbi:DUF397 domain-containing protein [Streptomyces sp. DH37]|uniref:DUF397 domain-containing protein n=1 Tax=Streptomyces sp. DH37 TaxID=3040122 RepID=UPI0024421B19|nr:DUF397 domain-containing protein [Streptomyces sp. DH37]MDG9705227.1 DUF397 domain-containing protein [Streptomyces sp. DH37]